MARILVVDDDPSIREMIAFKLTQVGHVVDTAHDGPSAIDLALSTRPEVALVDWMMPRMSGIEVCERLRTSPETGGTHIILLTARAQQEDIARGYEVGVDGYITKPFSPRALAAEIDAVLAARAGGDEAVPRPDPAGD